MDDKFFSRIALTCRCRNYRSQHSFIRKIKSIRLLFQPILVGAVFLIICAGYENADAFSSKFEKIFQFCDSDVECNLSLIFQRSPWNEGGLGGHSRRAGAFEAQEAEAALTHGHTAASESL